MKSFLVILLMSIAGGTYACSRISDFAPIFSEELIENADTIVHASFVDHQTYKTPQPADMSDELFELLDLACGDATTNEYRFKFVANLRGYTQSLVFTYTGAYKINSFARSNLHIGEEYILFLKNENLIGIATPTAFYEIGLP